MAKKIILMLAVYLLLPVLCAQAADLDLQALPQLPGSEAIWVDKPIRLNGISAPATHLRSSMPPDKIADFYKAVLIAGGWEFDRTQLGGSIMLFRKNNKFFYVGIWGDGKNAPAEVFLVNSPEDMAICAQMQDYLFKSPLAQDVPGSDITGIPRYPTSRRRFNLFLPAEGGLLIYEAEATPGDIAKFYRKAFKGSEWYEEIALSESQLAESLLPEDMKGKIAFMLFSKGKDSIVINAFSAPKGASAGKRSLIMLGKNTEGILYPAPEEDEGGE